MIYYFSGTGNSKWVASRLATALDDRLISIGQCIVDGDFRHDLAEGERIGFVMPVYSWGPAPVVLDFIRKWHINGYRKGDYVYAVFVCGDDIGLSVDLLRDTLGFIELQSAYSVQMPNNYILLPGFDVDNKQLEQSKVERAQGRVDAVAQSIKKRERTVDVVTGGMPWLKSHIVYPLFRKCWMSDKYFKADKSRCNGCGLCVRQCPTHNVQMSPSGVPQWQGSCQMCLSCIHRCPKRAIEYGKMTQSKGRYYFKW